MIGLDGRPLRPIAVLPPEVVAAIRAGQSVDLSSQLQLGQQLGGITPIGLPAFPTGPCLARPMGLPLVGAVGLPGMLPFARPLSLNTTQVEALAYDHVKNNPAELRPEVQELADTLGLNRFDTRLLDDMLRNRKASFYDDIEALYTILKDSKNPAHLLTICIKWMRDGTFVGTKTPIAGVDKAAQKFGLDTAAAFRLADSLERRDDPVEDLRKICTHLERSNKPSAMAMKLLKDLRDGNCVEECNHAPSIGSYTHKEETMKGAQKDQSKGDKGQKKERDRSQKRQRDKSRSRKKSRSKSRGRRRKSSRSKSRSRSRSRRRR